MLPRTVCWPRAATNLKSHYATSHAERATEPPFPRSSPTYEVDLNLILTTPRIMISITGDVARPVLDHEALRGGAKTNLPQSTTRQNHRFRSIRAAQTNLRLPSIPRASTPVELRHNAIRETVNFLTGFLARAATDQRATDEREARRAQEMFQHELPRTRLDGSHVR